MNKETRHHEIMKVRRLLEGSLNGKFRETTWRRFLDSGYVQEYLDGDETWNTLRELAQEELKYQRELEREVLGPSGTSGEVSSEGARDVAKPHFEPVFTIKLAERERKRADVLLKISMRQAAERLDVKRFRNERLGGRRLFYDEAEAYISPGMDEEINDRELADLGRRLERDYSWRRDDAAWFVLADRTPRLRPLTVNASMHQSRYGPSYCKITLHVAPWIPSEEVERAFVRARDQVRGGSGPGTVGKQRLEVLRFVEEQRAEDGRRPNFEALLKMWNQEHPHWAYADYRALSKAYREAYQEVVYPKYQTPGASHSASGF
jgi:hypothetical protein